MNKEQIKEQMYDRFFQVWGYQAQARMAIEEMSELTKELCKLERCRGDKEKEGKVVENIIEEIADVLNMIDQLTYYFGKEKVAKVREQKTIRTLKRLEDSEVTNE